MIDVKKTQCQRILKELKTMRSRGMGSIELSWICLRYGSRIFDLRKQGYKIETRRMSDGNFRYILSGKDW